MLLLMTLCCLLVCLVFGGGTKLGFMGDVTAQLTAIPLLLMAARRAPSKYANALVYGLPGVIALVAAYQFAPLAGLGVSSDFHDLAKAGLSTAGVGSGWSTVTLTPQATAGSIVSILPAVAVAIAISLLDAAERWRVVQFLLAFAAASLLVGLLQVAQGRNSPMYFFDYTNFTDPVGFFANRNHYSSLLYTMLTFAGVTLIALTPSLSLGRIGRTGHFVIVICLFALILGLVAGLAMARSRAGLLLGGASIVGIALMAFRLAGTPTVRGRLSVARTVSVVAVFALVFAGTYGLERMMSRAIENPLEDYRGVISQKTLEAATMALPFGTGLGSFVTAYGVVEDPQQMISSFANRAHNDAVEFLLELSIVGAAIIGAFLWWLSVRAVPLLRKPADPWPSGFSRLLAQAALLSIILILLHSFADYPLRTTAMAAVFAVCCGLLIPPRNAHLLDHRWGGMSGSEPPPKPRKERGKSRHHHGRADEPAQPRPVPLRPQSGPERYMDSPDWPDSWKN